MSHQSGHFHPFASGWPPSGQIREANGYYQQGAFGPQPPEANGFHHPQQGFGQYPQQGYGYYPQEGHNNRPPQGYQNYRPSEGYQDYHPAGGHGYYPPEHYGYASSMRDNPRVYYDSTGSNIQSSSGRMNQGGYFSCDEERRCSPQYFPPPYEMQTGYGYHSRIGMGNYHGPPSLDTNGCGGQQSQWMQSRDEHEPQRGGYQNPSMGYNGSSSGETGNARYFQQQPNGNPPNYYRNRMFDGRQSVGESETPNRGQDSHQGLSSNQVLPPQRWAGDSSSRGGGMGIPNDYEFTFRPMLQTRVASDRLSDVVESPLQPANKTHRVTRANLLSPNFLTGEHLNVSHSENERQQDVACNVQTLGQGDNLLQVQQQLQNESPELEKPDGPSNSQADKSQSVRVPPLIKHEEHDTCNLLGDSLSALLMNTPSGEEPTEGINDTNNVDIATCGSASAAYDSTPQLAVPTVMIDDPLVNEAENARLCREAARNLEEHFDDLQRTAFLDDNLSQGRRPRPVRNVTGMLTTGAEHTEGSRSRRALNSVARHARLRHNAS